MHLKRIAAPKSWVIKRKETKYLLKPRSDTEKSIPVLLILREILNLARNRKEAKMAINSGDIVVNFKKVKDEKQAMYLFDILEIVSEKKYYRLTMDERGVLNVKETNAENAKFKASKIINKKILRKNKTQVNLFDGQNFLYDKKCNVNDSLFINLKDRKIERVIPLKEGAKIFIFEGKHSGKEATVKAINKKNATVDVGYKGNSLKVLIKQIIVIE